MFNQPTARLATTFFFASIVAWAMVGAAVIVMLAGGIQPPAPQYSSLLLAALLACTVGGIVFSCTARVLHGQRRILSELRRNERYDEGYADGLAHRPVRGHLRSVD